MSFGVGKCEQGLSVIDHCVWYSFAQLRIHYLGLFAVPEINSNWPYQHTFHWIIHTKLKWTEHEINRRIGEYECERFSVLTYCTIEIA